MARAYALSRLAADAYRTVAMAPCPIETVQDAEGGWLTSGTATAQQYGAPVTLRWAARTESYGDAGPRLCGFGLAAGASGRAPKLLDVSRCR